MLSNRSLKAFIGLGAVLAIALSIGIIFLLVEKLSYTVYDQDTLIEGDLIVEDGNPIKLKNNAKLTVTGDAIIEDKIICDNGGVNLEIQGNLIAKNEMICESDVEEMSSENSGVNLVIKGNAVFSASSKIVSTGSVQLVDEVSKLLSNQDKINEKYDNLDQLEGIGIGPLDENGEDLTSIQSQKTIVQIVQDLFIEPAHAQGVETQSVLDEMNLDPSVVYDEMIKILVDEMREYIASAKPNDAKIKELVKELADQLGIEEGDRSDIGGLLTMELYIALTEAPSPEELTRWFFQRALTQGETVVIVQGEIIIGDGGKPPYDLDLTDEFKREGKEQEKPKRILLHYDFSDGNGLALQNITITGLDGVHYGGVVAPNCNYKGNTGGDAMRFTGRAGRMRIGNITLNNGDGGTGETVVSPRGCEEAKITGGDGGKPGNIKLVASREFIIDGAVTIVPGQGGIGGGARATLQDPPREACPAENAKQAEAIGGAGGDSKQRLRTSGSISGIKNITIDPAIGGIGGPAIADAQKAIGDDGNACGCAGGNGGNALAIGGKGGDASTSVGSKGGDGGHATALAGEAGYGGSCGVNEGPGGIGGNGGNAIATPGKGGSAHQQGVDGSIVKEQGGDAGFGGDGCVEGKAGAVGTGQTPGVDAIDGKNTCKGEVEPKAFISVIKFNGLSIPVFQLRVAGPDACDGDHWHGGPAKSTTGEIVNDPAPQACGFGKRSEVIPIDEVVNKETMIELFGPSITEQLISVEQQEVTKESSDEGCSMVRLCMVGGGWVTCPGQEDIVARNEALGCFQE